MKIPEISDKKLGELMKKIKPVVRFSRKITQREDKLVRDEEGDLYYIQLVHPRNVTFTWEPKLTRLARGVNPNAYKTIQTIHSYGAPVFFKPSVAEILAQIPEDDLERCVAFETNSDNGFTEGSEYHTAETRLYELLPKRR